ncbi:MAG: hypothetical protein ACR2PR_06960 [Pseudohongiellaceae bacterium]
MSDEQTPENETPISGPMGGRPSKAALDARNKELNAREAELEAREKAIAHEQDQLHQATQHEGTPITSLPPRVSADEAIARTRGENQKSVRRTMGQHRRLDVDKYVEQYQDKKLMLVNDMNGDVQRWIDEGAEPVPVMTTRRQFEGITDKHESQWVRFVGGDDGMGNHFFVYLLMIDPERYNEVKISPERERQRLIHQSIYGGGDRSDMDGAGPKLPTYQPHLPSGERGFDETRETIG